MDGRRLANDLSSRDDGDRVGSMLLDKEGNTCDHRCNLLTMETNKRTYAILISLVALWCGGIVLAPILRSTFPGASSFLYSLYAPICHQIDARSFHVFDEKLGVCIRCSSIYLGFFLSLLAYPLFQRLSSPSIPMRRWIAIAVVPMAIDVLLNVTGVYHSTALTRTISGALFGAILPFYIVPPLMEGIAQLRNQLLARGGSFHARKA